MSGSNRVQRINRNYNGVVCRNCGRQGHVQAVCRTRPNNSFCTQCRRYGHSQHQCNAFRGPNNQTQPIRAELGRETRAVHSYELTNSGTNHTIKNLQPDNSYPHATLSDSISAENCSKHIVKEAFQPDVAQTAPMNSENYRGGSTLSVEPHLTDKTGMKSEIGSPKIVRFSQMNSQSWA